MLIWLQIAGIAALIGFVVLLIALIRLKNRKLNKRKAALKYVFSPYKKRE